MPTTYFDKQLRRLRESLTDMGEEVGRMLEMALTALYRRDAALAEETVALDRRINLVENSVTNKIILLIAANQPLAGDLRFLAGGLRIAGDLERIGDIAANLARRAKGLARLNSPAPLPPEIPLMADRVQAMLGGALAAFAGRDLEKARRVLEGDDEVDGLNRKVREEMVEKISRDGALIHWGLEVIKAAAHLERMGDHSTNVAEDVIYIYSGRTMRHSHSGGSAAARDLADGDREDREDKED